MDFASWIAACVLSFVFVIAGFGKWRDPHGTEEAIRGFGLPHGLAPFLARALPAAEFVVAAFLLIPGTSLFGALAAFLLLMTFVMLIAWSIREGRSPECRCFGQIHSKPVGVRTIIRNLALASLAGLVLLSGGLSPIRSMRVAEALTAEGTLSLAISLAALAVSMVALVFAWQVRNAMRGLGAASESQRRLAEGDVAPPFELESSDGTVLTVGHFLLDGLPAMLLFTSAGCPSCKVLYPDIARWAKEYEHVVRLALVSTGPKDEVLAISKEHGFSACLHDLDGSVSATYGADLTPSAIVVSPRGIVLHPLVAGPEAIKGLLRTVVTGHTQDLWWRATGSHIEFEGSARE